MGRILVWVCYGMSSGFACRPGREIRLHPSHLGADVMGEVYLRFPQDDCAAAETMASFSPTLISFYSTKLFAVCAMNETYCPWFFQLLFVPRGPAHGTNCSSEQPFSGSISPPSVVRAHTLAVLTTPSPSMSGSHASPCPSASKSFWSAFGTSAQLSTVLATPSPSSSPSQTSPVPSPSRRRWSSQASMSGHTPSRT